MNVVSFVFYIYIMATAVTIILLPIKPDDIRGGKHVYIYN